MTVPGIDPRILFDAFVAPVGVHTAQGASKPKEMSSDDLFVVAMAFYYTQLSSAINSIWETFRTSQTHAEERKRTDRRYRSDQKRRQEAQRRHFESIDPSFELQVATLLEARRQAAQFRYFEGDEVSLRLPA